MYPYFILFSDIFIYIFGISLFICFFVFLWSIRRLGKRFWYSFSFFSQNILWFILSIFVFSRLFYVVSRWQDMKFIKNPFEFFVMNDFNFSLFWAIFGFLLVARILLRLEKNSLNKYIDGIVLSFLAVMVVGYIWALFWGQVFWRETTFGIELSYQHHRANVPFQVPIFPLPIVYALGSFLIFCAMYILSLFIHIRGYIGYMGIMLFCTMILIFESFSGKQDIISVSSAVNMPQIFAGILWVWAAFRFYSIFSEPQKTEVLTEKE